MNAKEPPANLALARQVGTAVEAIQAEVEEAAGTEEAVVDTDVVMKPLAAEVVQVGSSLKGASLRGGLATLQTRLSSV